MIPYYLYYYTIIISIDKYNYIIYNLCNIIYYRLISKTFNLLYLVFYIVLNVCELRKKLLLVKHIIIILKVNLT